MSNAAKQQPYIIKSDPVEERYARGWHCLGKSADFTSEPQAMHYFGKKLAVYRGDQDNKLYVLDSYCPHMGADLSRGKVTNNNLHCPFHDWSWGGDGKCKNIPYADKIPEKAVIGSYPTTEVNGLVFVWHDPEGNDPIPDQYPQRIEDYYSGEWTDWNIAKFTIHSNCRELVDNMADMAHFGPVHYSTVQTFKNIQDGHTFTQFMSGGHEILAEEGQGFTSVARYEGPAYMTTTMTGSMEGKEIVTHLLVTHVPVNTEQFDIRLGVMMKKIEGVSEEQNQAMVDEYTNMAVESFVQDVDIWNNKIRVDNPLLCDGDGPVNMVRKWYSQFYMDVAEIPKGLQAYKERETKIKYAHATQHSGNSETSNETEALPQ
ncbi:MAG: aromatic ring-hydroxylating dioxygenase subunit alpha [Pseudomonadales bacterium]|nr:aromatic ring-hydroxylating dioxygenase subunit alpha [Pseudomonadales bacterium]